MKRLLVLAVLCLAPVMVVAHPGKTDRRGGHKCLKGCEEWGLFYGEYHLHDKYGRAIRIGRKRAAGTAAMQSAATGTPAPATAALATTQTVTVYRTITIVQEEDVFASNPLVWALLVLLLLLLILRRTRREPQKQ